MCRWRRQVGPSATTFPGSLSIRYMKLRHQVHQYMMPPGTGCVTMATEVNFSDSEACVVVLRTPFCERSRVSENVNRPVRPVRIPRVSLEGLQKRVQRC